MQCRRALIAIGALALTLTGPGRAGIPGGSCPSDEAALVSDPRVGALVGDFLKSQSFRAAIQGLSPGIRQLLEARLTAPATIGFLSSLPEGHRLLALDSLTDYALVDLQSRLPEIARLPDADLPRLIYNSRVFADHGVGHLRDILAIVPGFLEAATAPQPSDPAHGLLLGPRPPDRLQLMKDYAQLLVFLHDRGMKDLTRPGRKSHPIYAAKLVFAPAFQPVLDHLFADKQSPLVASVRKRYGDGPAAEEVLRDLLSLSMAHSKHDVDEDHLNHPDKLAALMRGTVGKPDHFGWLAAAPASDPWLRDIIDTLRVVRAADALRPRGSDLRTSGGHRVLYNPLTGRAEITLAGPDGFPAFTFNSTNPLSIGESDLGSVTLGPDGNLHCRITTGGPATTEGLAMAIASIAQDVCGSFQGATGGRIEAGRMKIVLEGPPGHPDTALAVAQLLTGSGAYHQPQPIERVPLPGTLPSPPAVVAAQTAEARRWAAGSAAPTARPFLASSLRSAGMRIPQDADVERLLAHTRVLTLSPGETLFSPASRGGWVYVIASPGFHDRDDRELPVGSLAGERSAITIQPRRGSVRFDGDQPGTVYAIEAAAYRDWHRQAVYEPTQLGKAFDAAFPGRHDP